MIKVIRLQSEQPVWLFVRVFETSNKKNLTGCFDQQL